MKSRKKGMTIVIATVAIAGTLLFVQYEGRRLEKQQSLKKR